LALLLAAVAVVWGQVLTFGFTHDDRFTILANEFIRSPQSWLNIFTLRIFRIETIDNIRPLTVLTTMADYRLWELDPSGYHFTNLLLHLACVAGLWLLLRRLGSGEAGAMGAALFFAIHPLQCESVAAISYREDLLVVLALIGALLFHLRRYRCAPSSRIWFAAGACGCVALAMAAKESAFMIPLIIAVVDLTVRRTRPDSSPSRLVQPIYLFYAGILALFVYLRFGYGGAAEADDWQFLLSVHYAGSHLASVLTGFKILLIYIFKLIVPYPLYHDAWIQPVWNFADPWIWAAWGVLAIAAVGGVIGWRKWRPVCAGGIWFCVSLIPVMGFIPLNNPYAERYLYLPLAGVALALAFLPIPWPRFPGLREERAAKHWPRAMIAAIFTIFTLLTLWQARAWRDDLALYGSITRTSPANPRGQMNMGNALRDAKRDEESLAYYRRAVELMPTYYKARFNLASALFDLHHLDEAAEQIGALLGDRPDYPDAAPLAIRIAAARGDRATALSALNLWLANAPRSRGYYQEIIKGLYRLELFELGLTAIGAFSQAFADDPMAVFYRGEFQLRLGLTDDARVNLERFLNVYTENDMYRRQAQESLNALRRGHEPGKQRTAPLSEPR